MIYDLLILGAGWTSDFLIPLLTNEKQKYAATSTTGRGQTIKFRFDPDSTTADSFKTLPETKAVLITFPLNGPGQSQKMLDDYHATHSSRPHFIQLGSTGIWQIEQDDLWITRHSAYDQSNARAIAEDELKGLGGVILNLSGLWGGERQPRNFVSRVIKDKQSLREKGSLHMIHGQDVARAIFAVMSDWPGASRWMLTDGFCYCWWALALGWGSENVSSTDTDRKDAAGEVLTWVRELMEEDCIRALPRSMEQLGRCYDSREFWQAFKLSPVRARI